MANIYPQLVAIFYHEILSMGGSPLVLTEAGANRKQILMDVLEGDFLIMIKASDVDSTDGQNGFPSGWTVIEDRSPTGGHVHIAHKFFGNGESINYSLSNDSNTGQMGLILAVWRGVDQILPFGGVTPVWGQIASGNTFTLNIGTLPEVRMQPIQFSGEINGGTTSGGFNNIAYTGNGIASKLSEGNWVATGWDGFVVYPDVAVDYDGAGYYFDSTTQGNVSVGSISFTGAYFGWMAALLPARPDITDVNTTESWNDGSTGLVITGSGLGGAL